MRQDLKDAAFDWVTSFAVALHDTHEDQHTAKLGELAVELAGVFDRIHWDARNMQLDFDAKQIRDLHQAVAKAKAQLPPADWTAKHPAPPHGCEHLVTTWCVRCHNNKMEQNAAAVRDTALADAANACSEVARTCPPEGWGTRPAATLCADAIRELRYGRCTSI